MVQKRKKKDKKKAKIDYPKYIKRISSHDKIIDICDIFREFLKESLKIKYEFTFEEILDIISKKRVDADIKEKFKIVCLKLEELEFRKKKPSKKETRDTKALIRELIKKFEPEDKKDLKKKVTLNTILKKAIIKKKKKSDKSKKIIFKIKKAKEEITKDLMKEVDKKIEKSIREKKDKEVIEIARFVDSSLNLDMHLAQIKRDLHEMGFKKEKVDEGVKLARAQRSI